MKPFKYGMENILEYRKNIEDEKIEKFSKVQREYLIQENILMELESNINKANGTLIESFKDTIKLKNLQQYINYLREKKSLQKELVEELGVELSSRQEDMALAQQERKIIEKHKEKSLNKYRDIVNKQEQDTLDELALYSYLRR